MGHEVMVMASVKVQCVGSDYKCSGCASLEVLYRLVSDADRLPTSSTFTTYELRTKLDHRIVKQELCFLALGSSIVSSGEQKCSFSENDAEEIICTLTEWNFGCINLCLISLVV